MSGAAHSGFLGKMQTALRAIWPGGSAPGQEMPQTRGIQKPFRLFIAELRLSFLKKRRHTFLLILGGEQAVE